MAQPPQRHYQFEAIGTHWTITLYEEVDEQTNERVQSAIRERIDRFDANYSRFREDSLVTAMSRKAGDYQLPHDAQPLLDLYQKLYATTGGDVTPLIGNLLSDAGYDADYSLKPKALGAVPEWNEVLDYEFPKLHLKKPALLDFGAAGKGYLADLIARVIERHNISAYCVDASGDIRQRNVPADDDRIGLEHPTLPGQVIGVAHIGDGSLCGSASNRRTWGHGQAGDGGDLHHIMDPHSRLPTRSISALWVSAATALEADGLATALFFAPAAKLRRDFTFEYLILYDSPNPEQGLHMERSNNFPAELFLV